MRSIDAAPASWRDLAAAWVAADPPGARPLKAGGRVAAVRLPGVDGEVVLKRWPATWRDRFRVPRPLRAFRRAYALRVRGVACPEPLLAAAGPGGEGVYVTALAGPADGREVLDLHRATLASEGAPAPFDALPGAERRAALHRLGRFLRRLHDAEVTHRDLKAPNLVAWRAPRGVSFALVDLDGARVRRTRVSWRRRARDVARLDASVGSPPVSRADRLRVLDGYYASFERPALDRAAFARRVARASARKRGPGGAPSMKSYLRLLRYVAAPPRPGCVAALGAAVAVGVLNTATFATGLPFFRVLFGEAPAGTGAVDRASRRGHRGPARRRRRRPRRADPARSWPCSSR